MIFLLIVTGVLLTLRLIHELYYRRADAHPLESR